MTCDVALSLVVFFVPLGIILWGFALHAFLTSVDDLRDLRRKWRRAPTGVGQ